MHPLCSCSKHNLITVAISAADTVAVQFTKLPRKIGANVVALGHTADDCCESPLLNMLFTGRLSALPAVTYSRSKDFRLIRPLIFVPEQVTTTFAEECGLPIKPCICSEELGTVR